MLHVRIVAPPELAARVFELVWASPAILNVVHLKGAAHKPVGDLILFDVTREEASVILGDLKELDVPRHGSIAVVTVDSSMSDLAVAAEKAAHGLPSDAVVWEEVEQRTSENTELSLSFIAFMVLAMQIASVGILLDQPILLVGAMVVGPEFGPLAGLSVALVERRRDLARRSLAALGVGFPAGMLLTHVTVLLFRALEVAPDDFIAGDHPLTEFISEPDFFSFFVAYVAGTAGILSLTNAKSGALIGVLISVTTIPAASYVSTALAYGEPDEAAAAAAQLGINLFTIVVAGVLTLYVQRRYYVRRRREHLMDPARAAAGLPLGRSARKAHRRDTPR